MDEDLVEGKPLVVHIVVALCDNQHQGIVPVPAELGNGQDPGHNLYWGARYGVFNFLQHQAHWEYVLQPALPDEGILDAVILRSSVNRQGVPRPVYLVAEAWDGRRIREAVRRFLELAAGHHAQSFKVPTTGDETVLAAGGASHAVAYVGHNGLMDFSLTDIPEAAQGGRPRSSIVLACASKNYFANILDAGGSHPLLLTTGLMAPEAYSLDAAIRAWLGGKSAEDVRRAAASAYHSYQGCGLQAAERLFGCQP
jgi:hypothetical protein